MGLGYSRSFRLLSRLVQVLVPCWYRYRSARLNVANG